MANYDSFTLDSTYTITGKVKPASRPRYNPRSTVEACCAAARVSLKHEITCFVIATVYGLKITYDASQLTVCPTFYAINGLKVGHYVKDYLTN